MNDIANQQKSNRQENTKLFFEGWQLYQRVVANNYMKHKEMIELLKRTLGSFQHNSLRILELGCGDAHVITQLTAHTHIDAYVGIDLSSRALSFAEQNLRDKIEQLALHEGDMLAWCKQIDTEFDCIIAGHSLHHLNSDGKLHVFKQCRELMAPSGCFFFYDLAHRSKESREQFLLRCVNYFEACWHKMSDKQLAMIRDHVLQQDYPESPQTWMEIGKRAGFQSCRQCFRDDQEMYVAFEFNCH